MKQLTIALMMLALAGSVLIGYVLGIKSERNRIKAAQPCPSHVKLIDWNTDERGLTSVRYVEDKDTFALDYLDKQEYLDLINQ